MPFTYRDPSTLREMSEQQLLDSLKELAGGILRELQRRGYEIQLNVLADSDTAHGGAEPLEITLRHAAIE
ncbi:hypothetical protein [Aureimonas sp. AU22]|uniref:hypothetical protein n=1 Tax=Aureimonas sp. AU22 TaxID=1638162 RepID=UPI00078160A8|nr:hypothetical protein [Aureimonas sp. AU22]